MASVCQGIHVSFLERLGLSSSSMPGNPSCQDQSSSFILKWLLHVPTKARVLLYVQHLVQTQCLEVIVSIALARSARR